MSLAGLLGQLNFNGWALVSSKFILQPKAVHVLLRPKTATITNIVHQHTTLCISAAKGLNKTLDINISFHL